MINFDDSFKNQFLYAKSILDKYGFKATFFEVCGWIGKSSEKKSWQDIAALQQDGMDIESHTLTHPNLNTMSSLPAALDYQIGGAKQCFLIMASIHQSLHILTAKDGIIQQSSVLLLNSIV